MGPRVYGLLPHHRLLAASQGAHCGQTLFVLPVQGTFLYPAGAPESPQTLMEKRKNAIHSAMASLLLLPFGCDCNLISRHHMLLAASQGTHCHRLCHGQSTSCHSVVIAIAIAMTSAFMVLRCYYSPPRRPRGPHPPRPHPPSPPGRDPRGPHRNGHRQRRRRRRRRSSRMRRHLTCHALTHRVHLPPPSRWCKRASSSVSVPWWTLLDRRV